MQKAHVYKQKGPCCKCPSNWTASVFPLLRSLRHALTIAAVSGISGAKPADAPGRSVFLSLLKETSAARNMPRGIDGGEVLSFFFPAHRNLPY